MFFHLQMSSFASLYALELEYGTKAYFNSGQVKLFKPYFLDKSLVNQLRPLEALYPDWKNKTWILSYP